MQDLIGVRDIVMLILGTLLGTGFAIFLKRPKLKLIGSGCGSAGPTVVARHIQIQNAPGLFGISIGPIILFGWRVFHGDQFGISVDRSTARNCQAWLLDPNTKEKLTGLFWRVDGQIRSFTDIGPGESAEVILFGKMQSDPTSYFAFSTYDADGFRIPPDAAKMTDSRSFLVEIRQDPNRKMRFKIDIKKGLDGRLTYSGPDGGGGF